MIWGAAHALHIRPAEVEDMTIGELQLALDQPGEKRRPPEGYAARSPAELAALAERRRGMTLADKLAEARKG